MLTLRKSLVIAAVAFMAFTSITRDAHSGWPWGGPVIPDLRVVSVGPALVGPNHVRVIVANNALAGTSACWVKVTIHTSVPVTKYYKMPALPGNSAAGFDVWMGSGVSMMSGPGLVTQVRADAFNNVAESNESNNLGYFVSPAW